MKRAAALAIGFVTLTLVVSACGSAAGQSAGGPESVAATTALAHRDFAGLVDIGGGRQIWATCEGQGSPTVVLLSGHGNGAEDWSLILDLQILWKTWSVVTRGEGAY